MRSPYLAVPLFRFRLVFRQVHQPAPAALGSPALAARRLNRAPFDRSRGEEVGEVGGLGGLGGLGGGGREVRGLLVWGSSVSLLGSLC